MFQEGKNKGKSPTQPNILNSLCDQGLLTVSVAWSWIAQSNPPKRAPQVKKWVKSFKTKLLLSWYVHTIPLKDPMFPM